VIEYRSIINIIHITCLFKQYLHIYKTETHSDNFSSRFYTYLATKLEMVVVLFLFCFIIKQSYQLPFIVIFYIVAINWSYTQIGIIRYERCLGLFLWSKKNDKK